MRSESYCSRQFCRNTLGYPDVLVNIRFLTSNVFAAVISLISKYKLRRDPLASIPGLPRSVRVLIMGMRKTMFCTVVPFIVQYAAMKRNIIRKNFAFTRPSWKLLLVNAEHYGRAGANPRVLE